MGPISKIVYKLFGYRVAEMARHKDVKVVPRSKAKHDHLAFERHKKSRQDIYTRFGDQSNSRRSPRATSGAHNSERVAVVMVAAPLLMIMRLKIIGLSQVRGRASTKSQMMPMVVMRRR